MDLMWFWRQLIFLFAGYYKRWPPLQDSNCNCATAFSMLVIILKVSVNTLLLNIYCIIWTYKLSISIDIIVKIQVIKLLTLNFSPNVTGLIFPRLIWVTHLRYFQLFDQRIKKFAAARARKLCLWNYIMSSKALHTSQLFILLSEFCRIISKDVF